MYLAIRSLFSFVCLFCFLMPASAQETVYSKATYHGKGSVFKPCKAGAFLDVGTGGCYTCPKGYKRTLSPVASPKACAKTIKNTSTVKSGHYVAVTAAVDNQSDWKIRYRFLYSNKISGWYHINPKSKGSKVSEAIALYGLEVQWMDITTWKKLGTTKKTINNYQQASAPNIRVAPADSRKGIIITGSVFPPQAIKLVE